MKEIWNPSQSAIENSQIYKFAQLVNKRTWKELYSWSIQDASEFWQKCSDFVHIQWIQKPHSTYTPPPEGKMLGAKWFLGGTLNFAQNVLPPPDDTIIIHSLAENTPLQKVTARQLHNEVAKLARFLQSQGVGRNDRVCGVLANTYHAVAAMLATASLGATWSSCSPDFGTDAIVDRFAQIEPKVFFFTPHYTYHSKLIDCSENMAKVLERLPTVKASVLIGKQYEDIVGAPELNQKQEALPIHFEETPFDHPLYILFSSGTTGVPKCIVHGSGGTLLQHKKEHILHCDLKKEDRLFFFTTCGWMMWNWMLTALSCGSKLFVYDGSPRFDKVGLWELVDEHEVTVFGTSPKFLSLSKNEKWNPKKELRLTKLRSILSTGSPLLPEHFEWVSECVKSDIPIASISGGTDIVSCFMLGNPMLPIYSGEIQGPGLGMAIAAYDEDAKSLIEEKGELVCTQPFVSMPLCFFKDRDGSKYHNSYFAHFKKKEVWRHGDYISISEHGGITVHGRSDATLNPGGVRIGTAELYRCVESVKGVEDSLAISYEFEKGDPVILLFVKLNDGKIWNSEFEKEIKSHIRKHLSARHVPHSVYAVKDIPYTRNGKKMELAASQAVRSLHVPNLSALANPQCLEEYAGILAQNI